MERIELEYMIRSSPRILYNLLSTSNGLATWFADKVDVKDNIFKFQWNGSEDSAKVVSSKEPEYIRFHWVGDSDKSHYFEFRIKIDELTEDVALVITDFCEKDEYEETKLLWNTQVQNLMHALGS
jgi:uncharacterized protein YndB with AHSA1/START domain